MVRKGVAVSESSVAALVGLGVYLSLRLIDYFMPPGRHWTWIERITRSNKDPLPPLPPADEKDAP